jgi:hypothetical protein
MPMPVPASKPLGRAVLAANPTLSDIVVTPVGAQANSITEIYCLWVANTDSVPHAVILRSGAGVLVAPTHSLGEGWVIAGYTTWKIDGGGKPVIILMSGDKLQGTADIAGKVNVTAFGEETSN